MHAKGNAMSIAKQLTRLGAAFIRADGKNATAVDVGSFRATATHHSTAHRLGPLQDLPGFWEGTGFSLIARPNFSGSGESRIFLELNLLRETIEFTTIGSPVLNRGSVQEDIAIAPSLEPVFAIEVVQGPSGGEFLQLQYSQTALLNFRGMSFPHVTVGTLIKAF
jgi:hypothetical protein